MSMAGSARSATPLRRRPRGSASLRPATRRRNAKSPPLPTGTWAVRMRCAARMSGMAIPWREFSTREECVATFLEDAQAFFARNTVGKAKSRARFKIVELLSGQRRSASLFGDLRLAHGVLQRDFDDEAAATGAASAFVLDLVSQEALVVRFLIVIAVFVNLVAG